MSSLSHINDLLDVVLLGIFDKLTLEDKARASQVCSKWNTLINATYRAQLEFEFKEFQDSIWPQQLVLKNCKSVLKKLVRATRANLLGIRTFDRCDARLIGDTCPNLSWINLSRAYIKHDALFDLVRYCPRLNTLILNGCELDTEELSKTFNICSRRLIHLELDGFPENAPALRAIANDLTLDSLQKISLQNCGLFYVDYRYCCLFQSSYLKLSYLEISIYEEPRRTIDFFVSVCPKLEHLTLDFVEPNGDLTMEREVCFELLKKLTRLRHLQLDGAIDYIADLNDATLFRVIENCSKLETLEIGHQNNTTLSGKILTLLPKLAPLMQCLSLTKLKINSDEFCSLKNVKRLRRACFDYCHMIDLKSDSVWIGQTIRDCALLSELSLLNMTPCQDEEFWSAQLDQYGHLERKQFDFQLQRDSNADNLLILSHLSLNGSDCPSNEEFDLFDFDPDNIEKIVRYDWTLDSPDSQGQSVVHDHQEQSHVNLENQSKQNNHNNN